jgi:hypothetical protein
MLKENKNEAKRVLVIRCTMGRGGGNIFTAGGEKKFGLS